jgi:hypothetical protein
MKKAQRHINARRDAIVRVLVEDFVNGNAGGMSVREIAERIDSTPTKVTHACDPRTRRSARA